MRRYHALKTGTISILLFFSLNLLGQKSIVPDSINYSWCIEWLNEMKPPILADTLGRYGAKWAAAQRLMNEDCFFIGELFPVIEFYFGEPDMKVNYSENEFMTDKGFSMRYVLFKPPGTSTTGMKWLIVNCDQEYRITKFWIFTVDE